MRPARARGFTYLTVLFLVALLGLSLALTGELWRTTAQREREAQLLYIGDQYRRAIQRYYLSGPAQYPRALQDLLKDERQLRTERYLRKLYPDPITGANQWGLVKTPTGEIMGIYSLSGEKPLKTAGFAEGYDFSAATTYSDWKFTYQPVAAPASMSAPRSP